MDRSTKAADEFLKRAADIEQYGSGCPLRSCLTVSQTQINEREECPQEVPMSFSVMLEQLCSGMLRSMEIFFLTLLFSLPLGLLIAFGRMSKNFIIRTIVKIYISVMRGTPLMLQLLVVYFGPYYLFGMSIGGTYRFTAIILGFSLNYAAYFAEIYRSGIESMPVGQYEAGPGAGLRKGSAVCADYLSPGGEEDSAFRDQ